METHVNLGSDAESTAASRTPRGEILLFIDGRTKDPTYMDAGIAKDGALHEVQIEPQIRRMLLPQRSMMIVQTT